MDFYQQAANVMQLFNEPVYRQAFIAGGAAVFGYAKNNKHVTAILNPFQNQTVRPYQYNSQELAREIELQSFNRARLIDAAPILIGTGSGIESAIKHSNPALGSYVVEGLIDVAAAKMGYEIGALTSDVGFSGLIFLPAAIKDMIKDSLKKD